MEIRSKLLGSRVRDNLARLLYEIPDEPTHEVLIRPYRSKRSTEQNAKMHAIIRDIAQGGSIEDTKRRLLMKWSGYEVRTLPDGSEYPVPAVGGSSKLTVDQMSEFIDWLEWFAAEWGVERTAA